MALQIANPVVIGKVDRLASATGLNKTRAVERAVDVLLASARPSVSQADRLDAILRQIDALVIQPSDRPDVLEWDENGLPV